MVFFRILWFRWIDKKSSMRTYADTRFAALFLATCICGGLAVVYGTHCNSVKTNCLYNRNLCIVLCIVFLMCSWCSSRTVKSRAGSIIHPQSKSLADPSCRDKMRIPTSQSLPDVRIHIGSTLQPTGGKTWVQHHTKPHCDREDKAAATTDRKISNASTSDPLDTELARIHCDIEV